MATITLQAARAVNVKDGNIEMYPEAESQSFKAGQFVYMNSGALTVCDTDCVTFVGMALRDASGTTGTMIPVVKATAEQEFLMNVYHATPESAISAWSQVDGTSTFELIVSSNKCYVDISATSNAAFLITGMYEGDTVGDTYGRVKVKVIQAASQVQG